MKTLIRFSLWIALLLSISACEAGKSKQPLFVIEAYQEALRKGDLDGAMALMADDVVETNGQGTFRGKDEVRKLYEAEFGKNYMDCGNNQVNGNKVVYECIYWVGPAKIGGERYEATIVDGKIAQNIVVGTFTP